MKQGVKSDVTIIPLLDTFQAPPFLRDWNVMVDIESLGLVPGSLILEIGAVAFKVETINGKQQWMEQYLSVLIDPESCLQAGLRIDGDTLKWWFKRNPERFAGDGEPLRDALHRLRKFVDLFLVEWSPVGTGEADGPTREQRKEAGMLLSGIWANGAAFDLGMLRVAAQRAGFTTPLWDYKRERCFRTFCAMIPGPKWDGRGAAHNALEDARAQARHMLAVFSGGQMPCA
jgi:hypothetical protein